MSTGFAAIPNWIVRDKTITAHEKLVYMVLSSKIGDAGSWFTGHGEIAEEAGISVSSVQRALTQLKDRGIVSWKGRIDPESGARLGNAYRITVDRLGQDDRPPRSEGPTPSVSVTEQKKNPEKEPKEVLMREVDWFEALWAQWPKKTAKKDALKAYAKMAAGLKHDERKLSEILHKLAVLALAHERNTPTQFQPMLSTIINGERWDDPLPMPRTVGGYQSVDAKNEAFYQRHMGGGQ